MPAQHITDSEYSSLPIFPTPILRDYKDGQSDVLRNGKVQLDTLGRAVMNSGEISDDSWGKFAPAIERWEKVTGRAAPPATKDDGKDGARRLSSEFTEWLMGLPAGWITGHGLSRTDELKVAGNGVVPQQAVLALRMLSEDLDVDSIFGKTDE
jgi:DNA (cytosine-5)-methyltransferase 1